MYIAPLQSAAATAAVSAPQQVAQKPGSSASSPMPEDTVTLSSAAQKSAASAGDVDHDGDSH